MIYFFSNRKNIKIGYTKNKVQSRLQQLNTGSDSKLYCIGYMQGNMEKEKELHQKFSNERIRQNGEWFYPSDNLIAFINSNNEKQNCYIEYDQKTKIIWEYFSIKSLNPENGVESGK